MMTLAPEEEQFLRDNILCVLSTIQRDGSLQSTPVYYFYENGKLFISVTKTRLKTRNVLRDQRVTVVVLHTEPPFPYIQVNGTAMLTEEDLEARTRRIFSMFRPSLPDDFAAMLKEQERQLMVVTPERISSNLGQQRAAQRSG